MRTTKRIEHDGAGQYIEHDGVKYRPEIVSRLAGEVTFNLPRADTGESHATVKQGGVTEDWTPSA